MSLKEIESANTTSGFYKVISDCLSGSQKSIPNFSEIIEEISLLAAERGFNDDEFSLLLDFLAKGPVSATNKYKLLPMIVPCTFAPSRAVRCLMIWFTSKYRHLKMHQNVQILQWIVGLIDHDLVDPAVLDKFYVGFYALLKYPELVPYACKLLCTLSQPQDVRKSEIMQVAQKCKTCSDSNLKYLQAVLSLFKGYKPHLIEKCKVTVKDVDVSKVLKSVPQKSNLFMKLVNRRKTHLDKRVLGTMLPADVHDVAMNLRHSQYKISSLVPMPVFKGEQLDKIVTCQPQSILKALSRLSSVPIPEDILSLLRDEVGFFTLMYRGNEIQIRFSGKLLHTLQRVFIRLENASVEDKEFLLSRIYELQMYMNQGLPCVSIFLAGYLQKWDGIDYRFRILSLIEWSTFDTFQELSTNILRPLYFLFGTSDVIMKSQILQTCKKLIINMFTADLSRVERDVRHPFLQLPPQWTSTPINMLQPLVAFVEGLIKLGMCLHPRQEIILLGSINFYETMNLLEFRYNVPMWTIIPQSLLCHTVFNVAPVVLNKVCKLLTKYHTEFLPHLRERQPTFYNLCADKINITSKYCQELINLLWNGQAITRREDGVMFKDLSEDQSFQYIFSHSNAEDLDSAFDIAHNLNILPYICQEREKNGPQFLQKKEDFFAMIEYYLEDVAEFIKNFYPTWEVEFSNTL